MDAKRLALLRVENEKQPAAQKVSGSAVGVQIGPSSDGLDRTAIRSE